MSTLAGVGVAPLWGEKAPTAPAAASPGRSLPADPRAPSIPASDPLAVEIDRAIDDLVARAHGRGGPPPDGEPPPASAPLERLIDERVQLCADLCQLLWATHEVERAIRRELASCTSSHETRVELLRQCFARSRRRLSREGECLRPTARERPDGVL